MTIFDRFGKKAIKRNPFEGAKKKILLIEPPFFNLFGYKRWYYPLTLTLVGTYLKEKGHEVKIIDGDKPLPQSVSFTRTETRGNYHLYEDALKDKDHYSWSDARRQIEEFNPDIVGLTSVTAKIDSANNIARIAKEVGGNDLEVVMGGPHAQGIKQTYPAYDFGSDYDYIVTNIPHLIDRTPDKKLIDGHEDYSSSDFSSVMTLTGCPNSCTFCCNSDDRRIIYRNIGSIEEELDEIKGDYGGEELIKIIDDCFFSNKKRLKEISHLIGARGFKFSAGSRIKALSEDKLETFKNNGGQRVSVGVESGSQKVLDIVQKRLKVEETRKYTKLLNDFELHWIAFVMTGFPFETLDDLKATKELMFEIQPTFISLNRFAPYPGTKIWDDYYRDSDMKFKNLFQLNSVKVVQLSHEMEDYIEKMFEDFDAYNEEKKACVSA